MEPPSKRIRVAAEDRLSDLPDCLIHSILSFLDSLQVVRTSVLSRRWRHLWRSVPCIDIDLTLFLRSDPCPDRICCKGNLGRRKVCRKEWRPFEEFANVVSLLSNARSLDKLRIHVPKLDSCDTQAIEAISRWVERGVQRDPAMINIHMDFSYSWGGWLLPGLGSSSSSRLTRLLLYGVKLGGGFAEEIRSGHAVLEELSLVRCSCQFNDITSKSLRYLNIDDCLDRTREGGMVVTAPKLASLHTSFSTILCPNGICVTGTSSFVKASVCVTTFLQMNDNIWEKLYKIFNVMHLELCGAHMMDGIQWMSDKAPKFPNMRTLLINGCNLKTDANIEALDRFLQNAPSLKRLTLLNCEFGCSKRRVARAKWRHVALESQNRMSFKCDNLEVIEIKHSKDDSVDKLFELLMGLWRNLGKTNIKLTKV